MTYGGFPKTVPGRPDLVSVIYLGERINVDKAWYAKVMWLAKADQRTVDRELEVRRLGGKSMLDDEYWA